MISKSSFNKFIAAVKQQVDHLAKELHTISVDAVLKEMGFPANWMQIQKI